MIEKKIKTPIPTEREDENNTAYSVKIISDSLNVRNTPTDRNNDNIVYQITDKGIYTITEEQDGFGKLEDGNWIMLKFTER